MSSATEAAALLRARRQDKVILAMIELLDSMGVSPTLPMTTTRALLDDLGLKLSRRLLVLVVHQRTVDALAPGGQPQPATTSAEPPL